MAASSRLSNAAVLLHDLRQAEALKARIAATAPNACAAYGGASAIVAQYGRPTGAGFWLLRLNLAGESAVALWEVMAGEAQASGRGMASSD